MNVYLSIKGDLVELLVSNTTLTIPMEEYNKSDFTSFSTPIYRVIFKKVRGVTGVVCRGDARRVVKIVSLSSVCVNDTDESLAAFSASVILRSLYV